MGPGRLVGTTDSGLHFERLLGSGGIGEVYEATRVDTNARVAVKTLLPMLRNVHEAVRRMEREARAGGLLDHPNIVDILEYGLLADGTPYLVMELVDGTDLDTVLEAGALHPRRAVALARQTLDGLAHAHVFGVLHRDLKPANLMLVATEHGERVKILDLGLAKLVGLAAAEVGVDTLTQTGAIFGTPEYMAPEQALGRPVSFATDLYAVGVLLFEMLTGRLPFVGSDAQGTLRLQASGTIPRLGVLPDAPSNAIESIVTRALQKQPTARFASAAEMRAALVAAEQMFA